MGPKKAGKDKPKKAGQDGAKKPDKVAKKAKKPGGGGAKKPGKGGRKLPKIIKTRQKILGGRQKVKRRFKIPGKKKAAIVKKDVVEAPIPEEIVIELPVLPPPTIKPRDVIIICLLWSYEMVHVYARAFKASWLASQHYFINSRLSNDIELTTPDSTGVMVATLGAAMGVGWLADGYRMRTIPKGTKETKSKLDRKWWIMSAGFILYLVTPFVGLLLVRESSSTLNVVLVAFQVAWYAVNPIRFWFIFHQVFPLSILYSRIITTCNLFAIGTVDYILSMFVEIRSHNTLVFVYSWTALILIMIFWMVALILMLPLFNKTADDIEAVRNVYSQSEAIDNFDERQKRGNYLCTVALIFPSAMFGATKELIKTAMYQYYSLHKMSVFGYTLHSGISLLAMPLASGIFFALKFTRQENRNFLTIGFAHFLNFLFVSCIIITVVWDLDSLPSYERQIEPINTVAITMIMVPKSDTSRPEFTIDRPYFEATIKSLASSSIPNLLYCNPMINESTRTFVVGRQDSRELFADEITFIKDEVLAYVERDGRLLLLRDSGEPLSVDRLLHREIGLPKTYQLTIFTTEQPCSGGQKKDANGALIFIEGDCLSFKAWARFYNENGEQLSEHWLIPTVDVDNTVQPDSIKVPTTTLYSIKVSYILDDRDDLSFESTEVVHPFTYQRYYLVSLKNRVIDAFSLDNLEVQIEVSTSTSLGTTASGIFAEPRAATVQQEIEERKRAADICPLKIKPTPPWAMPPYATEQPVPPTQPRDHKPHPPAFGVLMLPAKILQGLAFGTALVCYMHFLWMQSPFEHRTPILACFFSLYFFASWMTRNLIAHLDKEGAYSVLVIQSIALYWHIAWAYINHWRLKPESPNEMIGIYRRF